MGRSADGSRSQISVDVLAIAVKRESKKPPCRHLDQRFKARPTLIQSDLVLGGILLNQPIFPKTPMYYSYPVLCLKYINHEPRVVGMFFGLFVSAIWLALPGFTIWRSLPFLFDVNAAPGTVLGKRVACVPTKNNPPIAMMPLYAHGGRNGPNYMVLYEYVDTAGNKQTGEDRASHETWDNLKAGDVVAVCYRRSDPARSRLESSVWDFWPTIPFAALGVVILTGAIHYGLSGIRRVRRQVRIVRNGEAVAGRVKYAAVICNGAKRESPVTVLEYEFATTEVHTVRLEIPGRIKPQWKTGEGIVVLIDPKDTSSHAVDIFDARREDRERLFERERESEV